jgi:hypothetical protein
MSVQRPAFQRYRVILGLLALETCLLLPGCEDCAAGVEKAAVVGASQIGSTSTAGGTVVAFLRDRRDGHSGEQYWRQPVGSYPKIYGDIPSNPSDWDLVLMKSGHEPSPWVWFRYRLKSTTASGIPVEKLWDFCLNETVAGFRIVAVWGDAQDATVHECKESPTWVKYHDETRPTAR